MSYEIPAGETEAIVENGSLGERYLIEVESGTARFEHDERYAHKGLRVPADTQRIFTLERDGESIYGYGDGAQATVTARRLGFAVSLFGREFLRIDGNDTRGQLPTSIDGQNVTLDQQITGQTVTLEQDIVSQTLPELTGDTARMSAQGTVDANADQTDTLSAGTSQTSQIFANSGQLWAVSGYYVQWPDDSNSDNSGDFIQVEIRTSDQGVVLDRMKVECTSDSGELPGVEYVETWQTIGTAISSDVAQQHAATEGTLVTDSNGLEVEFTNGTASDWTTTRNVRVQFDVLDT